MRAAPGAVSGQQRSRAEVEERAEQPGSAIPVASSANSPTERKRAEMTITARAASLDAASPSERECRVLANSPCLHERSPASASSSSAL